MSFFCRLIGLQETLQGSVFYYNDIEQTGITFILFNLASEAVYIANEILKVQKANATRKLLCN